VEWEAKLEHVLGCKWELELVEVLVMVLAVELVLGLGQDLVEVLAKELEHELVPGLGQDLVGVWVKELGHE
jgi:hypothetical protein